MRTFKIKDENNIERDAQVIAAIEQGGVDYLVYSINRDESNTNIFVSKIEKKDDKNSLVDISDENEMNKIKEIVNNLIGLPLVGDE